MSFFKAYDRAKASGQEAKERRDRVGDGSLPLGYHHVSVPAEAFLGLVVAGAAPIKGLRVERPAPTNVTIHHRYTPGWAIVFGILGLFVFLLGALLFFIKRTDTVSVIVVDEEGGCGVTISGRGPPAVGWLLHELVYGGADDRYQDRSGKPAASDGSIA